MKSRHSTQSASGSRRGGPKHRSDSRSFKSSSSAQGAGANNAPSLWQRITSLFKGSSAAPAKNGSAKASVHPATAAARKAAPSASGDSTASSSSRVSRKPEMVEVTTPRLYVGNLSFDAAESDLSDLFKGVGQVVSVEVVSHKQTQRSKGFAFVQMQTVDEAKRAVLELHDKEFMGRKLVVSGAKNSDQHDGRSEPRFAA